MEKNMIFVPSIQTNHNHPRATFSFVSYVCFTPGSKTMFLCPLKYIVCFQISAKVLSCNYLLKWENYLCPAKVYKIVGYQIVQYLQAVRLFSLNKIGPSNPQGTSYCIFSSFTAVHCSFSHRSSQANQKMQQAENPTDKKILPGSQTVKQMS